MAADDVLLRLGRRAWAVIGLLVVAVAVVVAAQQVSVLVISVVLALFPAALLSPLSQRMRDSRVPNGLGAVLLVIGLLLVFVVPAWLIVPMFAAALGDLEAALSQGLDRLRDAVDWSRLPGSPDGPRELIDSGVSALASGGRSSNMRARDRYRSSVIFRSLSPWTAPTYGQIRSCSR